MFKVILIQKTWFRYFMTSNPMLKITGTNQNKVSLACVGK